MQDLSPAKLIDRQFEIDQQRTRRFPELLPRKLARMSASPLAFLRGAAPLFYEILQSSPELCPELPGQGWIVGDAHLENFGAFSIAASKSTAAGRGRSARFDLNDFDDAVRGPWCWDVLRLTTSWILAGRELGVDGLSVLELSAKLIESHVAAAFGASALPPPPSPVLALVERVRLRTKLELLDARTTPESGRRRFTRGERYRDLPVELSNAVPAAFRSYAANLDASQQVNGEQLAVLDSAFRVAGTGSLGALRIAVLTRGKGGADGCWIFDMKEQVPSSASALRQTPSATQTDRVISGIRACLEQPPRMLAMTELDSLPMVVRRLTPQEDKLNLRNLEAESLPTFAAYLGSLLGAAHRRGGEPERDAGWTLDEQDTLLQRAVALAGLHESMYLTFCARVRSAR